MKVIFLDIDGVVNCAKDFQQHRGFTGIEPYKAFLIGKLAMDSGAEVVLSSSWRGYKEGEKEIEKQVCKLLDRTPHLDRGCVRGDEIKDWLDRHPEVTKYAIIDDDSDMLPEQLPNFFQTSWETGVTPEVCEAIRKHLME